MSPTGSTPSRLIYDWNRRGRPRVPGHRVLFEDETLRDGLQSPSVKLPTLDEKKELLRYMAQVGVPKVNLGLPGAGPKHVEAIESLLQVILEEKLPLEVGLAVRTLPHEVALVAELSQKFGMPLRANAFLGTSPIRKYVEDWSDQLLLKRIDESIGLATREGLPSMFVTEDTTRSRPSVLRRVYTRALEQGARAICLADTVGHATSHGVRKLIHYVKKLVKDWDEDEFVELNWHGHSDRGLGLANAMVAWEEGVHVVHGTILGIGERVGNAQLDLLLVNLKLMGLIDQDLSALPRYVQRVSELTETPIPRQYPVFGADAFDTATGVHAAAVVKALHKGDRWLADRVYSAVPASEFGLEQNICIGHMSGRSNVVWWLERRGIEPEPEVVSRILEAAKASIRPLSDGEIEGLMRRGQT